MRAIVQRVSSGQVKVDGAVIGSCGNGLVLLVGVHKEDTKANAEKLAEKVANLRIFYDDAGKMNLGIKEVEGSSVLAISNFTVYGNASKSRRPSFTDSAGFEPAKELFEHFLDSIRAQDLKVETGIFGADMEVTIVNDGPVTLIVEA